MTVLVAVVGIAGCDRDDTVQTYQAPKDPPPLPPVQTAQANTGGEPWEVPAGWKPLPAGGMRFAAYEVAPGNPPTELTVIPVSPAPLLANVNRWRGQLGLPEMAEADLPKVVTRVTIEGVPADLVDLNAPGKRLLGAFYLQGGRLWSFKMFGPPDVVEQQKANFDAFIRSIHFTAGDAQPAPSPLPSAAAGNSKSDSPSWTPPPGWEKDPPMPMRAVSFHIGSGDSRADVIVTRLGKDSMGAFIDNVNRWRGQVGLPPVTDSSASPPQQTSVGGNAAASFDFTGPEGATADTPGAKRLIVVISPQAEDFWFFKIQGPAKVVTEQKAAFDSFLRTFRFTGTPNIK
jgi:hypothetical protein